MCEVQKPSARILFYVEIQNRQHLYTCTVIENQQDAEEDLENFILCKCNVVVKALRY